MDLPADIRQCYDAALLVRSGAMRPTDAKRWAAKATGMNESSAEATISNVRLLLNGLSYSRTMTARQTQFILVWIAEDFGTEIAKTAAAKVLEHVAYYAALPKGGPGHSVRKMAEQFLANLAQPSLKILQAQESAAVATALARTTADRAARLAAADPMPKTATVTATVYLRNPDVGATVLLRAGNNCEGCGKPAPFLRLSNGTPYLEVHHKHRLADGGTDTVENAIALCPNCHREAHHGPERVKFLK